MTDQPNKPDGGVTDEGEPRDIDDQAAIRNQSSVTPDDYPEPAAGERVPPKR